MRNTEEIYDEKIAPILLELSRICTEFEIPFCAAVEFDGGESGQGVGKSFSKVDFTEGGVDMAMIYLAMRARGNLDAFMINVSKLPHAEGHNSMALFMMGKEPG